MVQHGFAIFREPNNHMDTSLKTETTAEDRNKLRDFITLIKHTNDACNSHSLGNFRKTSPSLSRGAASKPATVSKG